MWLVDPGTNRKLSQPTNCFKIILELKSFDDGSLQSLASHPQMSLGSRSAAPQATLEASGDESIFDSIQSTPIAAVSSCIEQILGVLTDNVSQVFQLFKLLYLVSGGIVTLSIICFGCCIHSVRDLGVRYAIFLLLAINWCFAHLYFLLFDCQLPEYLVDKSRPDIQCAHADVVEYSIAAVEMISVLFVTLVPMSWLANLRINPKRKTPLVALCTLHTSM